MLSIASLWAAANTDSFEIASAINFDTVLVDDTATLGGALQVLLNGFTPAYDDVFEIVTDAPVELKIFNRWGKTIYKEKDYQNNWNGNDVPAGTYFYEIQLDDDASCKGWLQVLK